MKKHIIIFNLFIFLFILNSYGQLTVEEETFFYDSIEFETNDFYEPFYSHENTYTPITSYKGNVYFIWVDSNRRPKLGKIEDGTVSTVFLDNDEEDMYIVREDGHHKFSIAVDKKGYVHVIGDMHNYGTPSSTNVDYPEKYRPTNVAGLDYDIITRDDLDNYIMYWVSEEPENINSFEFVGGDKERAIPGFGFSYMAFHSDMNAELYVRSRSKVSSIGHYDGEMGSITARYDVESKKWIELGGLPPSDGFPNNYESLHKAIFWEDNGISTGDDKEVINWYQGFTGDMGFDFNNRMHVTSSICNNNNKEFMTDVLYAYSDDQGASFHQANGTPIELPLRVEEGNIVASESESTDGYHLSTAICFDKEGTPLVNFTKLDVTNQYGFSIGTYKYWNKDENIWTSEIQSPVLGFVRHKNMVDVNGIITFIAVDSRGRMIRDFGLNSFIDSDGSIGSYTNGYFYGIDQRGIREKNVLRGFYYDDNTEGNPLQIRVMQGIPNLTEIPEEWTTTALGDAASEENGMFNDIFQIKSTGTFDENFSGEYIHQTIEGDFELEARVLNVNYVSDASYAGLMIKGGNEENSSLFGVAITSYEGVKTISKQGEEFSTTQTEGYEPSEWLKITKNGNLLEAYRSDNGENWIKVDSKEIEMADIISYGLVAGSGNSDENGHARIDHVSITKDNALTTEEVNSTFSIYPNPTENIINITYSNFVGNEDVQIIDLNGRLLLNKKLQGINSIIDVSNLSPNLYLLRIINTKGYIKNKKLIIE